MSLLQAFIVAHPPLIIPEVGKGDEIKISKTIESYKQIARTIGELKPDTIVITTPHSIMYSDYLHISPGTKAKGDFRKFGAKEVSFDVEYDEELTELIERFAEQKGVEAGTLGEKDPSLDHGTMVPLYYIDQYLKDYKIVRIGISGISVLDHYRLGKAVNEAADKLERRVVFVASGDLSHKLNDDGPYGYLPEGPKFDKEIVEIMKKAEFLKLLEFSPDFCELAGECGLRSFVIMAGALDAKSIETDFLSYEGTFGVGYALCSFSIKGYDKERNFDEIYENKQRAYAKELQKNEDDYVKLARLSLETYVTTGKYVKIPENLPEEMINKRAGVFVSIKKHGALRGCIGTILPVTESTAKEIIRNAVSAAVEDPRFSPVTKDELHELVYSVDILSEAEPIKSMDELDTSRYGVIVNSGRKRGLLLPNLDGIDLVEKQVEIAKKKAGIYDNEEFTMERFEVIRHK